MVARFWHAGRPPPSRCYEFSRTTGPWSAVPEAELTELEPDQYAFALPFDAARERASWRVVETGP